VDDGLSFGDFVDDVRRVARELREDVRATRERSATLRAEAQAIQENARLRRRQRDRPGRDGDLAGDSSGTSADRADAAAT
jgi:hypothetical protein